MCSMSFRLFIYTFFLTFIEHTVVILCGDSEAGSLHNLLVWMGTELFCKIDVQTQRLSLLRISIFGHGHKVYTPRICKFRLRLSLD